MDSLLAAFALLLCVLLACAALVMGGVRRVRSRSRLMREGVAVTATIVDVRPQSVGAAWAFHPRVRYEFAGRLWESWPRGGQHAVRVPGVMKDARSGDVLLGQPLQVFVDPRAPFESAVRGTDRPGVLMVVLGSAFGGLTLLFSAVGVAAALLRG